MPHFQLPHVFVATFLVTHFLVANFLVITFSIAKILIASFSITNYHFGLPFSLATNIIKCQTMTPLVMDNKGCLSVFVQCFLVVSNLFWSKMIKELKYFRTFKNSFNKNIYNVVWV